MEGGARRWCAACAKANHPGAISHHRKCEVCRKTQPSFAQKGEKPRWCKKCSKQYPGAIDVVTLSRHTQPTAQAMPPMPAHEAPTPASGALPGYAAQASVPSPAGLPPAYAPGAAPTGFAAQAPAAAPAAGPPGYTAQAAPPAAPPLGYAPPAWAAPPAAAPTGYAQPPALAAQPPTATAMPQTPPGMQLMAVTCPAGVQAGSQIQITVPAGVGPGQQFHVQVPTAPPAQVATAISSADMHEATLLLTTFASQAVRASSPAPASSTTQGVMSVQPQLTHAFNPALGPSEAQGAAESARFYTKQEVAGLHSLVDPETGLKSNSPNLVEDANEAQVVPNSSELPAHAEHRASFLPMSKIAQVCPQVCHDMLVPSATSLTPMVSLDATEPRLIDGDSGNDNVTAAASVFGLAAVLSKEEYIQHLQSKYLGKIGKLPRGCKAKNVQYLSDALQATTNKDEKLEGARRTTRKRKQVTDPAYVDPTQQKISFAHPKARNKQTTDKQKSNKKQNSNSGQQTYNKKTKQEQQQMSWTKKQDNVLIRLQPLSADPADNAWVTVSKKLFKKCGLSKKAEEVKERWQALRKATIRKMAAEATN